MSAESSLYALLVSDSDVMDLIAVAGASPGEAKAYPHVIPEDVVLPAVAYKRDTTDYNQTIHGTPPSSEEPTFSIFCVAYTQTGADALADAVQAAISADFVMVSRGQQDTENPKIFATVLVAQTSAAL